MTNDNDDFMNGGVLDDNRSSSEKERDWQHDELAGAVVVEWKKKTKKEWKTYTQRYQSSSLSCVSQSAAKAIEIITGDKVVWSAHPIYRKRVNFPDGGMFLQNAGDICKNFGTTKESLDRSQWIGEKEMNRDITVDTPKKVFGYVNVNPKDIDKIAEAIATQGHCLMIFHSSHVEYIREKPKYDPSQAVSIGHCICAVDYFIDETGEKVILIEDSTGPSTTVDKKGLRLINESFLKGRFNGAMYLIPITAPAKQKPVWKFDKNLTYGMKAEKDVAAMQNALKSDGLFPTTVPSSGSYLDITAKAVMAFQRKYAVTNEQEIVALRGRTVGPKTRAKLNELYGK